MESDQYSRIIFINIDDLQKISLNKLEQVCDGAYVFVDKEAKVVPFKLVQQLQHLGESVKWVAINGKTPDAVTNYISFFLGKLHEELEKEVEFAIISESKAMDHLVQYINEKGRSCIRVTNNKEEQRTTSDLEAATWSTNKEIADKPIIKEVISNPQKTVIESSPKKMNTMAEPIAPTPITVMNAKPSNGKIQNTNGKIQTTNGSVKVSPIPEKVARETIKRLVLSGNRPEALDSLKSYILLQYNSQEVTKQIDSIIEKMEKTNDIKVQNEAVVYNF